MKLITRQKISIEDNKTRYFEEKLKLTENSLTLLSQSIMILKYIIILMEKDGVKWIL